MGGGGRQGSSSVNAAPRPAPSPRAFPPPVHRPPVLRCAARSHARLAGRRQHCLFVRPVSPPGIAQCSALRCEGRPGRKNSDFVIALQGRFYDGPFKRDAKARTETHLHSAIPGIRFGKLERDWSEYFSADQLEQGRRIYRDSEIREVELTAKDAIIHRKVDKKEEYAVIDWGADGFSVRSSSTDAELSQAIAVAGLHESRSSWRMRSHRCRTICRPSRAPSAAGRARQRRPTARRRARPLLLVFQTTEGLTFQAFWMNPDRGRSRRGNPAAMATATAQFMATNPCRRMSAPASEGNSSA